MSDAIETQGFYLEIGNGDSPLTYTKVKEITNFSGIDGSAAEIDVTHTESVAKEWLMGLPDNGNFSVDTNYLPADPGQVMMREARDSRERQDFRLNWSDGSKTTLQGFVTTAPRSGAVDDKVSGSFNIRITGGLTEIPAP